MIGCDTLRSQNSVSISPNPFCAGATIRATIAIADTVSLAVYNIMGQNIMTICTDTILPMGMSDIHLSADSLVPGVYLLYMTSTHLGRVSARAIRSSCANTAVNEVKSISTDLPYPVPAGDLLSIPLTGEKKIVISGMDGRIYISLNTISDAVSVKELPTGIYQLSVCSANEQSPSTYRFLKQ